MRDPRLTIAGIGLAAMAAGGVAAVTGICLGGQPAHQPEPLPGQLARSQRTRVCQVVMKFSLQWPARGR
jgi:hypothetical protein